MMSNSKHNDLVTGLATGHAPNMGRDLISGYSLPSWGCAVTMFVEPRLDIGGNGRGNNGYPDLLAVVRSGGALFSAIAEVKRTPRDLLTSRRQFAKYLGCTPAFFIAVPSDLIHIAVCEIRYPMRLMPLKGIINANTGDIVILPRVQQFDAQRSFIFLAEALSSHRMGTDDRVVWRTFDMTSAPKMDDFIELDGMMVRRTYLPIALAQSRSGYPRDVYYDKYVRYR